MTQPAQQPADFSVVDALATELVSMYAAAEQRLLIETTSVAKTALPKTAPQEQLAALLRMRRIAQQVAARLHLRAIPLARQVAEQAAREGEQAALRSLRRLVTTDRALALTPHSLASANAIALDLVARLEQVGHRILGFSDAAHRAIIADAATAAVRDHITPAQAQARAWHALTDRGVNVYTDRAGREWTLSSYVEMAVRTATQRAFNASHQDRMQALGIQYFTVNADGHPCPLCLPFEGAVLSAKSVGDSVTAPAADSGDPVTFLVACTVDEAREAGLFHPSCRHVLLAYLPGVTKLPVRQPETAEQEKAYHDTQRLRALERQVRAAKREQLTALNRLDEQRARAKVRAAQARVRDHVANTGLIRRPRREQLNLGNH